MLYLCHYDVFSTCLMFNGQNHLVKEEEKIIYTSWWYDYFFWCLYDYSYLKYIGSNNPIQSNPIQFNPLNMFIAGSFTNHFKIGQNCFQIGNKSDTGCNEIFLIDFSWWQIMKKLFLRKQYFWWNSTAKDWSAINSKIWFEPERHSYKFRIIFILQSAIWTIWTFSDWRKSPSSDCSESETIGAAWNTRASPWRRQSLWSTIGKSRGTLTVRVPDFFRFLYFNWLCLFHCRLHPSTATLEFGHNSDFWHLRPLK